MKRRTFLQGILGALGLAVAPALPATSVLPVFSRENLARVSMPLAAQWSMCFYVRGVSRERIEAHGADVVEFQDGWLRVSKTLPARTMDEARDRGFEFFTQANAASELDAYHLILESNPVAAP